MAPPLRIDPGQRFSCSQCGRCCRRWEVVITGAERDSYQRKGVAQWFRESDTSVEGADHDPFEPVAAWPGFHRIRSRADGACGFLSPDNRCRLHEQLGAAHKPLTCRMFPFTFHPAPSSTVVTASFGCPTVVENRGDLVGEGTALRALEGLRGEWADTYRAVPSARQLVSGRSIDAPSIRMLRENLLKILARADHGAIDLRVNLRRIAHVLDDLTRTRVCQLADADFAEYIRLTLPHSATTATPPPARAAGWVARLMQSGFLYAVTAVRYELGHRQQSRFALRLARLRLLLHFHRLAPGFDRVSVSALRTNRVDLNSPDIQPVAYHYLRSCLEAIGARERPIVDDLAIGVSCLNAACAIAVMNAHAARTAIDRRVFVEALMESVDLLQARGGGLLGWALPRLAAGVGAVDVAGDWGVDSREAAVKS